MADAREPERYPSAPAPYVKRGVTYVSAAQPEKPVWYVCDVTGRVVAERFTDRGAQAALRRFRDGGRR